jgi:hypothetical protein
MVEFMPVCDRNAVACLSTAGCGSRPDVEIRRDLPERGHVDPVTDSHRNEPADSSPTDLAPDPSGNRHGP